MGMKLNDKLMLQGCREGYCDYGPATGILCWVYDVLGESYLSCLSGLMSSKVDACFGNPWSFRRRVDFSMWYCEPSVMLVASAKPQSARGASHQPAFMSGRLTISHTCLTCLLSEKEGYYFGGVYLLLGGSWAGKVGRVVCFSIILRFLMKE